MTIEESRNAFKEGVTEVSTTQLEKLQKYLLENYNKLTEQFTEMFKSYCQQITRMQEAGIKNPLSYIQFSILRYKLIEGVYEFQVDAYDQSWYGDKVECTTVYDVTPIFSYLEEFSDELIKRRRKYMQRVTVCDVKQYVLEESDKYKLAMTEFIRSALPQVIKSSEYEAIKREDLFVISVGEFRDKAELVYKEDRTEKDVEKVKQVLATDKEEGHYYEIFDELDLSASIFSNVRWLYCSGKKSQFINTEISNSMLMFCQFETAIFESTNFSNSSLVGVDFTGATLKDIDFTNTNLFQLNFENATLENIDFTQSNQMAGIKLTNAILINVTLPDELEVV